jgi:hypothetical protein
MQMRNLSLLSVLLLVPCAVHAQKAVPAKEAGTTYKDHVLPILQKHCLACHNADKAKSDLNIATYQALMAGGASGEAVKPGSPDQSLLYKVITHQAEPNMPPKGPKLPEETTRSRSGHDQEMDRRGSAGDSRRRRQGRGPQGRYRPRRHYNVEAGRTAPNAGESPGRGARQDNAAAPGHRSRR